MLPSYKERMNNKREKVRRTYIEEAGKAPSFILLNNPSINYSFLLLIAAFLAPFIYNRFWFPVIMIGSLVVVWVSGAIIYKVLEGVGRAFRWFNN